MPPLGAASRTGEEKRWMRQFITQELLLISISCSGVLKKSHVGSAVQEWHNARSRLLSILVQCRVSFGKGWLLYHYGVVHRLVMKLFYLPIRTAHNQYSKYCHNQGNPMFFDYVQA
jgi:hypothetical protein